MQRPRRRRAAWEGDGSGGEKKREKPPTSRRSWPTWPDSWTHWVLARKHRSWLATRGAPQWCSTMALLMLTAPESVKVEVAPAATSSARPV